MKTDRYRTVIVPHARILEIKIGTPPGRLPFMYHMFSPAGWWTVSIISDPMSAENIFRMRALGRQTSRLKAVAISFGVVEREQVRRIREFMFANLNKDPANPAYTR